ncbi:hypothetical protein D3C86_1677050 [compost metagenome]
MALQALAHAADECVGGGHLAQDIAPVLVQAGAHGRGFHVPRGAPQQLHAEFLFERLQVVADVGARHLELARGGAEVAGIDDVDEQAQGVEIHGGGVAEMRKGPGGPPMKKGPGGPLVCHAHPRRGGNGQCS